MVQILKKIINNYNHVTIKSEIKDIDQFYEHTLHELASSSNEKVRLAYLSIEKKDFDEAQNLLSSIISSNSENEASHSRIIEKHHNYLEKYNNEALQINIEIASIATILNLDIAKDYYKKAISLDKKSLSTINSYAIFLSKKGDTDRAINLLKELIKESTLSKEDEQKIYGNLGVFYKNISDWDNALKYQKKSLGAAIYREDTLGKLISSNNIAVIMNNREQYDDAYIKLKNEINIIDGVIRDEDDNNKKQALRLVKCDMLTNIVISLNHIFENCKNRNNRDEYIKESISYILASIELSETINNEIKILINYGNAANLYLIAKDFKKAKYYLDKTLLLSEKVNDKKFIALSQLNLADYYISTDSPDPDIALEYALSALNHKKYLTEKICAELFLVFAKIVKKKKNHTGFIECFNKSKIICEKLNLTRTIERLNELKNKI